MKITILQVHFELLDSWDSLRFHGMELLPFRLSTSDRSTSLKVFANSRFCAPIRFVGHAFVVTEAVASEMQAIDSRLIMRAVDVIACADLGEFGRKGPAHARGVDDAYYDRVLRGLATAKPASPASVPKLFEVVAWRPSLEVERAAPPLKMPPGHWDSLYGTFSLDVKWFDVSPAVRLWQLFVAWPLGELFASYADPRAFKVAVIDI